MTRLELNDRFAELWRKSREDAGKSQDYMAKALGVSKKTIQNWEQGTSCPSQEKGFEWFVALDLQPLPYYLQLLYPIEFTGLKPSSSEDDIEIALFRIIKSLPSDYKRKLLYLLTGEHGSSPVCMLELITAHLQTPLNSRLNIAQGVEMNYTVAERTGKLKQPEHIQPNMELLHVAIERGKEAVIRGAESYTAILDEVRL